MKFPGNIPLPIPYGWFFIHFSDELRAGDTARLFYFNRNLLLRRDESGELHLCQGENPAPLPVTEVNGIIWGWYHPENIQPLFEVHHMPELDSGEWMPYQKSGWTINTCIQEAGENAVDTAHFYYVHKLPEIDAQPVITYEGHRRTSELILALDKFDSQGKKCGHLESRVVTACCGPGQTWTRSFGLSDFLIIGLPTPVSEHQIELHFACSLPKSKEKSNVNLAQAVIQNASDQVEQDIPIWENKIYRPDPVLCDGDGPIAQYRKWFKQFYIQELVA